MSVFGALTIWFIYSKVIKLNFSEKPNESGQKMALIGQAATRLYTTEGISRNIIQNKDTTELDDFRKSIDTISMVIDSLKTLYTTETTQSELDSIGKLLTLKEENLIELLEFRAENASDNYYDRVLKRLEKADYLFGSTDYEEMVKDLEPYQQKVIVDYLQYGEEDKADQLSYRTAEELISTTKQVLLSLEMQEHEYQKRIEEKENKLLVNDLKISDRLQKIRIKIEQEEFQKSLERIASGQKTMDQTYLIMIVFGVACLITILIFGMIIIKDNNKSRLYRKELEEAKVYAEQLLGSREQIMATVTHDLRSPLSSILGYADLIEKTNLDSKQKNYLNQLRKSSDFTMKLVNDLLDLSRLESGNISIEKFPFVPEQLIKDVVDTNIRSFNTKNIEVKLELDKNLKENLISDPFRLQQILANLIGNAYKFTEEGEIKIIGKLLENKYLIIKIKDTGIGISKDRLKSIFEEFSQAESSTEKKYGGFGLGLTISKKMIELLNGEIDVESELGKGTTFSIKIPVEISKKKTTKQVENIKLLNAAGKKVLVVDDEQTQLDLISEILKTSGFKISTAKNGVEALKKAKENTFDAVFTDIQMPEMGGFELLKNLRKNPKTKEIPVIALSGMTDKKLEEYLALGFANYLIKPYTINALLKAIAKALNLEMKTETVNKIAHKESSSADYDLQDLEIFTDKDQEALKSIIQSLIKNAEINLQKIIAAEKEKDFYKVGFIAHKMLPMLRQIKAEKVVAPLEKLESQQTESLTSKEIRSLIEKLEIQLEKLLSALKNHQY